MAKRLPNYKYPLEVGFGYQQRNLAFKTIKNRKELLKYRKYLSKKTKIPQNKINYRDNS